MTPEFRAVLRYMISKTQHSKRQELIESGRLRVCSGCGADFDSHTAGCTSCSNRHARRKPEARAKQLAWYRTEGSKRRKQKRIRIRQSQTERS